MTDSKSLCSLSKFAYVLDWSYAWLGPESSPGFSVIGGGIVRGQLHMQHC